MSNVSFARSARQSLFAVLIFFALVAFSTAPAKAYFGFGGGLVEGGGGGQTPPPAEKKESDAPGNFGLEAAIGGIKQNKPTSFSNVSNDPARLIGRIIGVALSLVGTLFLLLTLYAGFLWMTARGDTKMVDKAKGTLSAAVIGLMIVVSAYALVTYVITSLEKEPADPSTTGAQVPTSGAVKKGLGESCSIDDECASNQCGQTAISNKCSNDQNKTCSGDPDCLTPEPAGVCGGGGPRRCL